MGSATTAATRSNREGGSNVGSDMKGFEKTHTTEVKHHTLNPVFDQFSIPVQQLCGGEYDRPMIVKCFDWNASGAPALIGQFTTTLRTMVARPDHKFKLVNVDKQNSSHLYRHSGTIMVKAKIYSSLTEIERQADTSLAAQRTEYKEGRYKTPKWQSYFAYLSFGQLVRKAKASGSAAESPVSGAPKGGSSFGAAILSTRIKGGGSVMNFGGSGDRSATSTIKGPILVPTPPKEENKLRASQGEAKREQQTTSVTGGSANMSEHHRRQSLVNRGSESEDDMTTSSGTSTGTGGSGNSVNAGRAYAAQQREKETVTCSIRAEGLEKRSLFASPDPYLELSRWNGREWEKTDIKTDTQSGSRTPRWSPLIFKLKKLMADAGAEVDNPVLVTCWDSRGSGTPTLIGSCDTTLFTLRGANNLALPMMNMQTQKPAGIIVIESVKAVATVHRHTKSRTSRAK
jgi:hypothetical protein